MSIDDIKNINKLRAMLKELQCEVKYLKECCKQAGLELAKNSYVYDYKEKNKSVKNMPIRSSIYTHFLKIRIIMVHLNLCGGAFCYTGCLMRI